jgi:endonuclease/exonuclease/phosphatase family metal-dependent hydrolase
VRRLGANSSLILGDFNAHSTAWGSRKYNGSGSAVQDWAATLDVWLTNRGSSSTCVAWRGESIVDLTWANPAAAGLVSGRSVSAEETLSDHLYVAMDVVKVIRCMWN